MTPRQLFESLPEPYRTRALNNMDPVYADQDKEFDLAAMLNSGADIPFITYFKNDIPERRVFWEHLATYYKVKFIIDCENSKA